MTPESRARFEKNLYRFRGVDMENRRRRLNVAVGVAAEASQPALEPGFQPGGQVSPRIQKLADLSSTAERCPLISGRQECRPLRQLGWRPLRTSTDLPVGASWHCPPVEREQSLLAALGIAERLGTNRREFFHSSRCGRGPSALRGQCRDAPPSSRTGIPALFSVADWTTILP
jgi:hypothetical protein